MKNISIREAYDWLYVDDQDPNGFTNIEWEHLLQFVEQKYKNENVVEMGIRRIRFINLVGVIQLKTARIEILPKLDLHQGDTSLNRRSLLNMLSITKQLPVQLNDRTLSELEKIDLSHVLVYLFITELYKALKRGLYRGYCSKTENMKNLKGRLLVSQHIRKNAFNPVNAFCEYDELSPNVQLNQVLKAALKIIYPFVQHSTLRTQTLMIFEMFDEVDDVYSNTFTMEKIQINRQNQHYEGVLQLAIAIINSTSMSTGVNKQIAFTFLFKMNDLYEGYVGECLKRMLAPTSYKLDLQHKEKRLLVNVHSRRENILLKPDFILSKMEQNEPIPMVIMDTKWKRILVNSHLNYDQGDIYQMYAYITAYKTAERCIILYPEINEESLLPRWLVPGSSPVKHIEVQTIRLDKAQHTIEDLGELLFNL
ncbi:McrC family protein [Peribacillus frigoritolerans]|uniref:McrC family protein n=1 Tax=Peribacillus frigoritolerans TaxID=450367 RepID=UPI0035112AAD